MSDFLTAEDIRAVLPIKVSLRELRRMIRASELGLQHRNRPFIRAKDLDRFIDEAMATPGRRRAARPASASRSKASAKSKAPATRESVLKRMAELKERASSKSLRGTRTAGQSSSR